MTTEAYVSEYLKRPLRSVAEVCHDRTHKRGLAVPPCQGCPLRQDRACTHPLKNLVLDGPRKRAPTRRRQVLPEAA